MVRNCTNMAPRAGAGIFASLALAAATAVAPSAFGQLQCGTIPSGSDGQIGIQGGFTQECNFDDCWDLNGNGACDLADEDTDMDGDCDVADCGWTGLAFPIDVVGAPPCPADVVVNGAVDVKDLLFMLGAWGPCPPKGDCPADFDLSGAVDVKDLLFLLGAWGPCPVGAGEFVDTLTFSLNTNRAGGDVYIVGPTDFKGVCQPDITNILATMCCSLEGKATGEPLVLHFPPVATDGGLWVVFVGRTGSAGILPDGTCEGVTCDGGFNDGQPCLVDGDCLGGFDGSNFPSHQVARLCDAIPDGTCDAGICNGGFNDGLPCETDGGCLGGCTAESALGRAYANISPGGTGNPGDWTDLHNLGSPPLGTFYDVALSMTGADPDAFDCSQFAGGCCLFDGTCTEDSHPFDCIEAGSTYAGDGVDCAGANCQPICSEAGPKGPCGQPDAGPCAFGNGSPGCDDPICCCTVCETMPECCLFEWTTACAVQATTVLNCAPEPGQPSDLATGPDETVDGYLRIGTDDFGSWADLGFGTNALGEDFNPVGDEPADGPTFGQYFSVYRQAAGEFESLTTNSEMDDICTNNNSMTRGITTLSVNTDTNADGVDDTKVSTWELISMSGMDTSWVLTQHVFNATPKGGPLVAIVTFEFEITNNTGDPVDFILHRHLDIDSTFGPGGFGNDNVGTRTNGAPGVDRFVYQGEVGHPEWSITLSSPTGGVYYGVKQLVNPQGNGCVDGVCVGGDLDGEPCKDDLFCLGGCEFTLAGTTSQICLNLGTPECWKNHIASVGYDTDGDSGANPGTDAAFGMEIPVSIPANDVVIVNVMLTYGAETPGGE